MYPNSSAVILPTDRFLEAIRNRYIELAPIDNALIRVIVQASGVCIQTLSPKYIHTLSHTYDTYVHFKC